MSVFKDLSAYDNLDFYEKFYDCSETQRKENIEVSKDAGLWKKKPARDFSKEMKQS